MWVVLRSWNPKSPFILVASEIALSIFQTLHFRGKISNFDGESHPWTNNTSLGGTFDEFEGVLVNTNFLENMANGALVQMNFS